MASDRITLRLSKPLMEWLAERAAVTGGVPAAARQVLIAAYERDRERREQQAAGGGRG